MEVQHGALDCSESHGNELHMHPLMSRMFATFLVFLAIVSISPVLGCATGQTGLLVNTSEPQTVGDRSSETSNSASSFHAKNDGPESMHLSSIRSNEFTALSHPHFPNHQVRIKKSDFCDPAVKYVFVVIRRV